MQYLLYTTCTVFNILCLKGLACKTSLIALNNNSKKIAGNKISFKVKARIHIKICLFLKHNRSRKAKLYFRITCLTVTVFRKSQSQDTIALNFLLRFFFLWTCCSSLELSPSYNWTSAVANIFKNQVWVHIFT